MKILIVGATGMLGAPVARQLQADGHDVRILSRNVEKARAQFDDSFEIVYGDVEQAKTLHNAMMGCEGVHISLSGGPTPDAYDRIEHQGTANVVQVAATLGVQYVTYLSGFSVNETNRSKNYATNAKFMAETAVKNSGIPYTIFRATWFMESLPLFIQNGRATLVGKQETPLSWVAVQDYAYMVSRAYQTLAASNQTLYIYGPERISMETAVKQYHAACHPEASITQMPPWMLLLMGKLARNAKMKDIAIFMKYMEQVQEVGGADEANKLLGKPTTTLADWLQQQSVERKNVFV